jgi:hypothetical protein
MPDPSDPEQLSQIPPLPPARAFAQGTGQVFQIAGVLLFLAAMFTCCGSSLLSKDTATDAHYRAIGWFSSQAVGSVPNLPTYSAQRAIAISLTVAIVFGMALAGVGLGMQADSRHAAKWAVLITLVGSVFWIVHAAFMITVLHSWVLSAMTIALSALFLALCGFAIAATVDVRRAPPPKDIGVLPADYKVPYSHYHVDPPEVRLEREMQERKAKLAVQQKELEALEEKLRRRMQEKEKDKPS